MTCVNAQLTLYPKILNIVVYQSLGLGMLLLIVGQFVTAIFYQVQ